MDNQEEKLDNPVWHALSETHQAFAVDYGDIKFYHPDYCPFGGAGKEHDPSHIDDYANLASNFYVVGHKPIISEKLALQKELICLQMIINNKVDVVMQEDIIPLGSEHAQVLFELVNLVQPGFFKSKTAELGDYFGIFKNGQLVSVTGERMQMNEFVEVSAIVTHPDHTGKGYAKQLIAHAVNKIFDRHKTPFLHVVETNTGAIHLYEKLGFVTRRKMSFWNLVKELS